MKKPNIEKYRDEWIKHNKWLKSIHEKPISIEEYVDYLFGKVKKPKTTTLKKPSYKIPERDYSNIPSVAMDLSHSPKKKSYTDKSFLERESRETQEEILAKARRISIPFNKGSYQYLGNEFDAKLIGRK